MWYVLKLDYVLTDGGNPLTALEAYRSLESAGRAFDHLELGYQFHARIRLKSGDAIQVENIQLYECLHSYYVDALAAIASGKATLMREARGVDFNLAGGPPR